MRRTDEDNDRAAEWWRLWRQRITYLVLVLAALGIGIWFVDWVSKRVGLDAIGEHYRRADEIAP